MRTLTNEKLSYENVIFLRKMRFCLIGNSILFEGSCRNPALSETERQRFKNGTELLCKRGGLPSYPSPLLAEFQYVCKAFPKCSFKEALNKKHRKRLKKAFKIVQTSLRQALNKTPLTRGLSLKQKALAHGLRSSI